LKGGAKKKKQQPQLQKVTEEGILFANYRNGDRILLTPESSIDAQKVELFPFFLMITSQSLGADIIIPLDELLPHQVDPETLNSSFERTHRWEERSLNRHLESPNEQAIYAVIHGGINPLLRKQSAQFATEHAFDGSAIGGSVGSNKLEMTELLSWLVPSLPQHRPIHLLGK
jgi:queuine tRNA-ribosyltransferase